MGRRGAILPAARCFHDDGTAQRTRPFPVEPQTQTVFTEHMLKDEDKKYSNQTHKDLHIFIDTQTYLHYKLHTCFADKGKRGKKARINEQKLQRAYTYVSASGNCFPACLAGFLPDRAERLAL